MAPRVRRSDVTTSLTAADDEVGNGPGDAVVSDVALLLATAGSVIECCGFCRRAKLPQPLRPLLLAEHVQDPTLPVSGAAQRPGAISMLHPVISLRAQFRLVNPDSADRNRVPGWPWFSVPRHRRRGCGRLNPPRGDSRRITAPKTCSVMKSDNRVRCRWPGRYREVHSATISTGASRRISPRHADEKGVCARRRFCATQFNWTRKWQRESHSLRKSLWSFHDNPT